MYVANREECRNGKLKRYDPIIEIAREYALKNGFETSFQEHWLADFYAPYFFIQKILGNPDGQWTVDVYQALDMSLPGIFAHRSALQGNIPIKIPISETKKNVTHTETTTLAVLRKLRETSSFPTPYISPLTFRPSIMRESGSSGSTKSVSTVLPYRRTQHINFDTL